MTSLDRAPLTAPAAGRPTPARDPRAARRAAPRSVVDGAALRAERRRARSQGARRAWAPADRAAVRDAWAALLVVLVFAWGVLPRFVQSVTVAKYRASVGAEEAVANPVAALIGTLLTLAIVAVALVAMVDSARDPHPGRLSALVVLLAPWLFLVLRDLFVGLAPSRTAEVYPVVVVAMWLLRPRIDVLRVLGWLVGLAALGSVLLAVVLPSRAVLVAVTGELVSEGKEIVPGGILVGFLTSGNNLGQFLVLGLPFVFWIRQQWARWPFLLLTLFAVVWSASRSSFGGVAIIVVAVVSVSLVPSAWRRWFAPVVSLVPFVLVVVLPLVTTDPMRYTNRGLIWTYSLDAWHRSPLVGLGANWYSVVGTSSGRLAATVFHGHNQFVQLAVTGGLVLLVLAGLLIVATTLRSAAMAASGRMVGVAYLAALAGSCVLEKAFAWVDNTSLLPVFVLPLAILLCGEYDATGPARAGQQHVDDRGGDA